MNSLLIAPAPHSFDSLENERAKWTRNNFNSPNYVWKMSEKWEISIFGVSSHANTKKRDTEVLLIY